MMNPLSEVGEPESRSTAYMLIGLPGIGKTTYAMEGIEQPAIIISSDAIRRSLFGYDGQEIQTPEHHEKVWEVFTDLLATTLQDKAPRIILDATFMTRSNRKPYIEMLHKAGYLINFCVFPMDVLRAMTRNLGRERHVPGDVILRMAGKFEGVHQREVPKGSIITYVN